MGIFNEFYKKEKPVFTGSRFGFGSGGGGAGGDDAAGASTGPFTISGGTVLTPGNGKKYHVFSSSGSLVVAPGPGMDGTINAFILAGGGAGGKAGPTYAGSAGGGAGGAVEITNFQIYGDAGSPVTYPVTVGTGAPTNTTDSTQGQQGNPSSIDFSPFAAGPSAAQISIQSMGGGGGACADQPVPVSTGGPGGCGGGGNSPYPGGALQAPPTSPVYPSCPGTVTVYGNAGHTGTSIYGSGGGGSGLGAVGEAPSADGVNHGGDGGNGRDFPAYPGDIIAPAIPNTTPFQLAVGPNGSYGGGGAGARYRNNHGSDGDPGGAGAGGVNGNAIKNTGSGGGGGAGTPNNGDGGRGGDGLVIVSYTIS